MTADWFCYWNARSAVDFTPVWLFQESVHEWNIWSSFLTERTHSEDIYILLLRWNVTMHYSRLGAKFRRMPESFWIDLAWAEFDLCEERPGTDNKNNETHKLSIKPLTPAKLTWIMMAHPDTSPCHNAHVCSGRGNLFYVTNAVNKEVAAVVQTPVWMFSADCVGFVWSEPYPLFIPILNLLGPGAGSVTHKPHFWVYWVNWVKHTFQTFTPHLTNHIIRQINRVTQVRSTISIRLRHARGH